MSINKEVRDINTMSFNVYREMIAGEVPNHTENPYQTIVLLATDNLHTDKVHIGMLAAGEFAYYFAAPSNVFTSIPEFATPLAAAIPGHPNHQGDGAYVLTQGDLSVAAVLSNLQLRLYFNETKLIELKLIDMELPIFYVDETTVEKPLRIESTRGRSRRLADGFSRKTIQYSAIAGGLSLLIATVASLTETALSTSLKNASEKTAAELNILVNKIEYSSPLSQQIGQVNKLSATVVRAGGWIMEYRLKNGHESFAVSLPEWVTQDYIVALGKGAVAEHDPVNNNIRVTKK